MFSAVATPRAECGVSVSHCLYRGCSQQDRQLFVERGRRSLAARDLVVSELSQLLRLVFLADVVVLQ